MNSYSQPGLPGIPMAPITNPLVLEIRGLVPGKKNNKMLVTKDPRGRPLRKPLLITKPEYQEALERITESLRSQLLSACQTASGETLTASSVQSWIASSLPADDAWTHIPKITVQAELCAPGQEGASITVRRL